MTKRIFAAIVVVAALTGSALFFITNPIAIALLAASIIALIAMGILVKRKFIAPIKILTEEVDRIKKGDYSPIPHHDYMNELGSLACEIENLNNVLNEKVGMSESMLANIMTPMVVVAPDGTIRWLNESIVRLLEHDAPPESFVGQDFSTFFYGDKRETISEKCLKERKKQFVKGQVDSRKGNTKYISVASAPIFDFHGDLLGGFTTIMDFTNIKLKEDFITAQNAKIAEGVAEASKISQQLAKTSEEINAEVNISSSGIQEQRTRTEEVATSMEQMNASIMEVSRNSSDAALMAHNTQDTARSGSGLVDNVITVMHEVNSKAGNLKDEMETLETHSNGITSIMQVISDIADQTNLLALNAAIEAARAGEAGRGFSVVADEIRKLAEKTMLATKEVGEYISAIQQSSEKSTDATEDTLQSIKKATELCNEAGNALQQILDISQQTASQVEGIATAAEEQSAASEEINRAIDAVNEIAGHTTESMEMAANSVAGLASLATELDTYMSRMQSTDEQ